MLDGIIALILAIIFVTDLIISFIVLVEVKKDNLTEKDNTEEIREKSNKIILNNGLLRRRLFKAYPTFINLIKKYKK